MRRAVELPEHIRRLRPRVVAVETFPFGRFSLAAELITAKGRSGLRALLA